MKRSLIPDMFWGRHSKGGERFAEIFTGKVFEETNACICRIDQFSVSATAEF